MNRELVLTKALDKIQQKEIDSGEQITNSVFELNKEEFDALENTSEVQFTAQAPLTSTITDPPQKVFTYDGRTLTFNLVADAPNI